MSHLQSRQSFHSFSVYVTADRRNNELFNEEVRVRYRGGSTRTSDGSKQFVI